MIFAGGLIYDKKCKKLDLSAYGGYESEFSRSDLRVASTGPSVFLNAAI